jgi:hypothetical protein
VRDPRAGRNVDDLATLSFTLRPKRRLSFLSTPRHHGAQPQETTVNDTCSPDPDVDRDHQQLETGHCGRATGGS